MDNILEILVPLIFAAIYFFGNMLSGKKEDEETPPAVPRRSGETDDESAERQRRIQEEIRRKIMERRRAGSGGSSVDQAAEPNSQPRPAPRAEKAASSPTKPAAPSVARERQTARGAFSWDQSDDAYDRSMEKRMRQIEATNRQAEQLKRQADKAHMKNQEIGGEGRRQRKSGGYFSGRVRESLDDPGAARVAFIYGEVLGRPVALRDASSSAVPGLS